MFHLCRHVECGSTSLFYNRLGVLVGEVGKSMVGVGVPFRTGDPDGSTDIKFNWGSKTGPVGHEKTLFGKERR